MLLKKNVRSEYKTKVKTKFLTYWTIIKSWKVLIRASYQSRLSVTSQFLLFLPQTHRYTFSSMLLQEKMENVSRRLVIEFEEHNMHIRFAQQESAKQLSSLHIILYNPHKSKSNVNAKMAMSIATFWNQKVTKFFRGVKWQSTL